MESDPWAVLGVEPGAPLEVAHVARRRLARELHPDAHAGAPADEHRSRTTRMAAVNDAFAAIEAQWRSGASEDPAPGRVGDEPRPQSLGDAAFSVGLLPVEAFEALVLVARCLGEVLVVDEPYLIEAYLEEPSTFYHLSLAPEAGGSEVTVDLVAPDSGVLPPIGAVRDLLADELATLLGRG